MTNNIDLNEPGRDGNVITNSVLEKALRLIDKKEDGLPFEKIILTDKAPGTGYMIAEYKGKRYILIRKRLFEQLTQGIKREESQALYPSFYNIPIVEDEKLATEIWLSILKRIEPDDRQASPPNSASL